VVMPVWATAPAPGRAPAEATARAARWPAIATGALAGLAVLCGVSLTGYVVLSRRRRR
jgi:hypothetical protein